MLGDNCAPASPLGRRVDAQASAASASRDCDAARNEHMPKLRDQVEEHKVCGETPFGDDIIAANGAGRRPEVSASTFSKRILPEACLASAQQLRLGQTSSNFSRIWEDVGKSQAQTGRSWPAFCQIWPNSAGRCVDMTLAMLWAIVCERFWSCFRRGWAGGEYLLGMCRVARDSRLQLPPP